MDDQAVEHFQYTYDKMGNKTGIWKYRRGMPGESGEYGYEYDHNGRLTAVKKDGHDVRTFSYQEYQENWQSISQRYGKVEREPCAEYDHEEQEGLCRDS